MVSKIVLITFLLYNRFNKVSYEVLNMEKKILLVENELSIRQFLKINFDREGFTVLEADRGDKAIEMALVEKPQVVLLDIGLEGDMDGFQVCSNLRKHFPKIGIIMLTARSQEMERVMGLEFGADDYVVKPFNPLEVMLRVKALIRRIDEKFNSDMILNGPFRLDLYSQKIYKNDKEIDVTPKEYMLFKIFVENPGKALSRDELMNMIWGYNYFGDLKIVDVNIRRLRSKIEDESSKPKYIETVWGTGYRWNNER